MSHLAEEFRRIIKLNMNSTNPSIHPNSNTESTTMTDSGSTNYVVYEEDYINANSLSTEVVNDLRTIALRMSSSGLVDECVNIYVSERKVVMDACLHRLNVEKMSGKSVRRLEWGVLETKIKNWIVAAKVCFKCYFENEKRLCEDVFQGCGDNVADGCFVDIVTDHVVRLLEIAEVFSCIRPASERLFKMLELYDTLCDLLPLINKMFSSDGAEFLRIKAGNEIVTKLAAAAKENLVMFEKSLVNEQSIVVHGELIHRLCKYVMHYVYKLCDHKQSLMSLCLCNLPSTDAAGVTFESLGFEEQNQFSVHIVWIITSLVSNLEVKSRLCKDPAASRFFVMNNFCYIVQKIEGRTELREIVGNEIVIKLNEKFKQAKGDYLKLTFEVVLKCLRDEGLNKSGILSFRVSILTDRLKRFNVEFERLQKDLGKLVVQDFKLVLELRKSIVEMLVITYTSFLLHTKNVPRLETYIKYSAEGFESAIQEFFICKENQ